MIIFFSNLFLFNIFFKLKLINASEKMHVPTYYLLSEVIGYTSKVKSISSKTGIA